MIPLFADLTGRRVVIFGGGNVAARKAAYFVKEADVEVVSRSHGKAILSLPATRNVLDVAGASEKELNEIVKDAFIVIAALPDKAQNNRIGRICRRKKILFNNADGDSGDLIIPAISSGRKYTVAISTHGKSPMVSRFIREHIDQTFSHLDGMIALQESLRRELKITKQSQKQRSAILRSIIIDPEIWDALSQSPLKAERIARRKYLYE
ncbi:MAG: precorrin-2 dehydrogenase [Methanoregula sp. PtaU1.Bin051]|nr:MAG: precorrin-2 dehydrogenase [Methanoregula sp. PtaU1.Bin051]